ncbi:unnamed protein product [Brassica oleracea]
MANSFFLLADLKAECCSNTMEVRLLRFWEAKNVRKGNEITITLQKYDNTIQISLTRSFVF